jgi:hypothetical protein
MIITFARTFDFGDSCGHTSMAVSFIFSNVFILFYLNCLYYSYVVV